MFIFHTLVLFLISYAPKARRTSGALSERDSSGTTVATPTSGEATPWKWREGDGADSPTRAAQRAAKRLAQQKKMKISRVGEGLKKK
jgi:hypothetical protein